MSASQVGGLEKALPTIPRIELTRWSAEGLQLLLKETPFSTPTHTSELLRVTGGWPQLVERAITLVGTRTREETLETIAQQLRDPAEAATLVSSTDVPASLLATWVEWFPPGEACSLADLEAAEITEDLTRLLTQLELLDAVEETPHGIELNAILAAAICLQ